MITTLSYNQANEMLIKFADIIRNGISNDTIYIFGGSRFNMEQHHQVFTKKDKTNIMSATIKYSFSPDDKGLYVERLYIPGEVYNLLRDKYYTYKAQQLLIKTIQNCYEIQQDKETKQHQSETNTKQQTQQAKEMLQITAAKQYLDDLYSRL